MIVMNKKAFSLVELLVAMAIIAILISISVYGITIVQRNARNTKRTKINQDLKLVISDIETFETRPPQWIEYNQSENVIEVKLSNGADSSGKVPIKGFNDVQIVTSTLCTGGIDGNSYGRDETSSTRIWICLNPDDASHGVRLEKKGLREIVDQKKARDNTEKSDKWSTAGEDGDELVTYWAQEWLKYELDLPATGNYLIEVEATNRGPVPTTYGYFEVAVIVDGKNIGIAKVLAEDGKYNSGTIAIPNLEKGTHNVQVKWINDRCDKCSGGYGDANIQIKTVAAIRQ